VSGTIRELEKDGLLDWFADTGFVRLHVNGGKRNVCTVSSLPFFALHNDALPIVLRMRRASAIHLYLVLVSLAYEQSVQSFDVKRSVLRKQTGLSRPSFNAGEKECVSSKLLRRKGDRWTMLQPPAQQKKKPKTSFPKLTPQQWSDILVFVDGREYEMGEDSTKWLNTSNGDFVHSVASRRNCPSSTTASGERDSTALRAMRKVGSRNSYGKSWD
jgi:hypothetical protein